MSKRALAIIVLRFTACATPPPEPPEPPRPPKIRAESLLPEGDSCLVVYETSGLDSETQPNFQAFVDKSQFDDLQVVSPADYQENSKPMLVGHISRKAFQRVGGRALFEFLLDGQMIRPQIHLGAKFCLVKENVGENEYEAEFSGYHLYRTDGDRQAAPLDFSFEVKSDGTMLVRQLTRKQPAGKQAND